MAWGCIVSSLFLLFHHLYSVLPSVCVCSDEGCSIAVELSVFQNQYTAVGTKSKWASQKSHYATVLWKWFETKSTILRRSSQAIIPPTERKAWGQGYKSSSFQGSTYHGPWILQLSSPPYKKISCSCIVIHCINIRQDGKVYMRPQNNHYTLQVINVMKKWSFIFIPQIYLLCTCLRKPIPCNEINT